MDKKKAWGNKWLQCERIGKGGQGLIYKTTTIDNEELFALKILKKQNNPNKRARMWEVAATVFYNI